MTVIDNQEQEANKNQEGNQEGNQEVKEKTFTSKQLEAILARKESKWEAQMLEMKQNVENLTTKLQTKQEGSLSSEEKIKQYQDQLKTLEREKVELVQKQRVKTLESELIKACAKTTRPEIVAKLLKEKVKVDDNDKVYGLDKYDSPIDLAQLVNEFVSEYPEFSPAPKSGTGIKNAGQVIGNLQKKENIPSTAWDYDQYITNLLNAK